MILYYGFILLLLFIDLFLRSALLLCCSTSTRSLRRWWRGWWSAAKQAVVQTTTRRPLRSVWTFITKPPSPSSPSTRAAASSGRWEIRKHVTRDVTLICTRFVFTCWHRGHGHDPNKSSFQERGFTRTLPLFLFRSTRSLLWMKSSHRFPRPSITSSKQNLIRWTSLFCLGLYSVGFFPPPSNTWRRCLKTNTNPL